MRPILIGVGLVLVLCGALGLVFGLEISDIERGQTQAIVGAVILTGGILTMALAIVLGKLDEIAGHLSTADLSRPRSTAQVTSAEFTEPVPQPAKAADADEEMFGAPVARADYVTAPAALPPASDHVEPRRIEAEAPEPKRASLRPSISLSSFGRARSLATPTLPPAPPPVPADTPRDPSEVAAAAVAAAIEFPPNFDFDTAPTPPEAEEAVATSDEPVAAAEVSDPRTSAFGEAFSRQLSEKAAATRYDPFSFDARSRPLGEPSSTEAIIPPPPPPPPPLPVPSSTEAAEPRPAETSAFVLRPSAEVPAAERAAPDRATPDPTRFPLRSMTLPRGTWPEAPKPAPAMPEPVEAETAQDTPPAGDWFERALSGFDEPPLPHLTLRSPNMNSTSESEPREAIAEAQEDAPEAPPTAAEPEVVGRYESNGATYVMYADGSIDAETESGVWRFSSLTELKAYIESRNTDLG